MKIFALCLFVLVVIGVSAYYIMQYNQTSSYRGPVSSHFNGKRFYNPTPYQTRKFSDIIYWHFHSQRQPWPNHVENTAQPDLSPVKNNEIKSTFINHSTFLIQTAKFNILTDPIWSYRASPFSWIGPRRVRDPGVAFEKLPKVDVVLISHSHYDHLDLSTLKKLAETFHPVFLVPLGDKELLNRYGIENVVELDWWQTYRFNDAVITFLPSQHWSARWLNDANMTLWGSYGIDLGARKIYFGGDTGYAKSNFELIKQKWGKPDLAFLPIGAYLPEWFMHSNHMNPRQAVEAHQDLESKKSIAIHFGTFQLSDEGIDQPVKDLQQALEQNPSAKNFVALKVGESNVTA
jgi:N-acyl-phosphatidylethanolamine-hydrolysing phospholipase D